MRTRLHPRCATLMGVLLFLGTVICFSPVMECQFIGFDDPAYVTENAQVRSGISAEGISWAFTTMHAANYHPVTWLSHMADVELFGLSPRGPHLVNLLLHAGNAVLLFLLLRAMTGALLRSAFVAALFAVHPMHVESVAWIAERKDVLCLFFSLLTLGSYVRHAKKPGAGRYSAVVIFFAMSLLSKPMAVTLPFLMILLDYWPLARAASGEPGLPILEKIPLLLMSAASCAVTVIAQHRGGALARTVVELPLLSRVGNSVIAYERYLRKMFRPAGLSVFYPQAYDPLPSWEIVAAALFLLVLSAVVWMVRKRFPWAVTGWLWYLGTLVPVIGLVKVGEQFIADRYTYLPFVGLFLILSWGVAEGVRGWRHASAILAFAALAIIGCLGYATRIQVGYWKNDEILNRHAIEVTRGNWLAKHNLASILAGLGRMEEAVALYRESIRDNSLSAGTHNDLAVALGKQGRFDEAYDHLRTALQLNPDYAEACNNLGLLLSMRNRLEEAEKYFGMAIRLKPAYPDAYYNLGLNDLKQGRFGEAAAHFREALRWRPGDRDILEGLQEAISRQGK